MELPIFEPSKAAPSVFLGVTSSTQGMRPNSIIGVLRLPTHHRKIQETYICHGFSWGCNTLAAQDRTAELGLATGKLCKVYRLQTTRLTSCRMWQRNINPPTRCSGPRMVRSPSGWINSAWESMNVNVVGTLPRDVLWDSPSVSNNMLSNVVESRKTM